MVNKDKMTEKMIDFTKNIIDKLSGADRREALAKLVIDLEYGGQTYVAKVFNVGRDTLRKGMEEVRTGSRYEDAFKDRGRKKNS